MIREKEMSIDIDGSCFFLLLFFQERKYTKMGCEEGGELQKFDDRLEGLG